MQIGSLTAFLSYLLQILMSVMMATFMFMLVPRAEVCASASWRCSTPSPTSSSQRTRAPACHRAAWSFPASTPLSGAEESVLCGISLAARPANHRDHRRHRQRQDDPAEPDYRG